MTEDVLRYANFLYHRYATSIDAAEIPVIQRSFALGAQRGKARNHAHGQQFLCTLTQAQAPLHWQRAAKHRQDTDTGEREKK